ncbi:MAG: hypothetical protein K6A67_11340 [Bacteroidales bacterium]|nr:hypothetical protein [Bacteroidales bacterium]
MNFDLVSINKEFQQLMQKHDGDKNVSGESSNLFRNIKSYHENTCSKSESDTLNSFFAMLYNAYDELCNNHPGLRNVYDWYAGAEFVGFPNPYDIYIGTGEEECRFLDTDHCNPKLKQMV